MIGVTDIRFLDRARAPRTPRDLRTFVKLEYAETNVEWFLADGRAVGRPSGPARRGDESHRGGQSMAALALALLLRFGGRGRADAHREPVADPAADGPADSNGSE